VIGPKYPSCDASMISEGVGEGEITLGVAGILFLVGKGISKVGRDGCIITPDKIRALIVVGSKKVEGRCLSLRDRRSASGERADKAIDSSETRGAEQNCTALLKDDMVPFCAVRLAQEGQCRESGGE
jgi:hypothetical protein